MRRCAVAARHAVLAATLTVGGACGDDGPAAPSPSSVTFVAPATRAGLEGVPLADSAVVRVADAAGEPLAGVRVTFETRAGGEARPAAATTGPDGLVRTLWIPRPGLRADTLTARAGSESADLVVLLGTARAGERHEGRGRYVEYFAGSLPLVISAPHGGTLEPAEVPDRQGGTQVRDFETDDLALRMAAALEALTGERPHLIVSRLHRRKLDPNREIVEAAEGHPLAQHAWLEYHAFVEHARRRAADDQGAGLYLDLHGHGHAVQRLELGHLVSGADLALGDPALEALGPASSLRALAAAGASFVGLARGPRGLGQLFADEGYPAVPSADDPHPAGAPYFSGGYSTARHGSRDGGVVDGVQLEANRSGVRDTAPERQAFAEAAARALVVFLTERYGWVP